jgi:putative hydrolase of HD superfamily
MVPQEYEQGVTPEAKFVKDLDRLEMAIQGTSPRIEGVRADRISLPSTAREYEKAHGRDRSDLQCFFDNSLPYLRHPEVCQWGNTLASERERDLPVDVDGRGGA